MSSRSRLLFESSLWLGVISAIFTYGWRRLSAFTDTTYLVQLVVPASAVAGFLFVGAIVPNLTAVKRWTWPIMLTLPLVYGVILQLSAALWLRGPNPIVKQQILAEACEPWQRWQPAVVLLIIQIVVFSARSLLTRHKPFSE